MEEIITWILEFVKSFGYLGIFIMTFIESTFVPIPAEVTMVPAGYLVYQGEMNGWKVMASAIAGTVGGALFNYWIAYHWGRYLFVRYGKFFFLTDKKLAKMERFFEEHGAISMFSGRLLPGVRHYISFPAGLARMNLRLFCLYTALGGGIWMGILMGLGYFIGYEEELIRAYLPKIVWVLVALVVLGVFIYWRYKQRRNNLPPASP